MPKRELLTFDGNPLNYWLFINNFEVNIAKRVPDAGTRLAYLIQHCTGKAREAIKNCAIISGPEQGYRKAQEILYHRFGQKHIIAHAHITKIVEGPQIKNADVTGLSDLSVQMQNCTLTLVQMGYEADVNSSDNLVKLVKRLPAHLQSKWADRAGSLTLAGTEPTFMDLAGFVEEKALLANTMYGRIVGATPDKDWSSKPPPKVKPPLSKGNTFATQSEDGPQANTASILICPLCTGQHRLWKCELMKAKSREERKSFVRQARLCDNCLGSGHMAMDYRSKMRCQVNGCGWKHHTMLHVKKKSNSNSTPPNHPAVTSEETGTSTISGAGKTGTSTIRGAGEAGTRTVSGAGDTGRCGATESGKKNVCLRIIPVVVKGKDQDNTIVTNALLDPGSDVTLCDASLMEKLQVHGRPKEFSLATVNGASDARKGFELSLSVRGLQMQEEIVLDRVWTVDTLCLPQGSPPTKEDTAKWPHLKGIDFPRTQSDKVSVLIGSDVPEAHWVCDQRRGRRGQPYAVCTPLGWTLMGPLNSCDRYCFSVNFVRHDDETLHQQMESLFRSDFNESLISSKVAMSVEDQRALLQMEDSVKLVNGHYQLGLPWKRKSVSLPNNREFALGRLRYLKKRFQRDLTLFEKYKDTINGYVSSGYARRVPCNEEEAMKDTPVWYLPHHPVFHPQKPGNVRVVFDCAAKFKGTSLNDQLLQGPDLTNGLLGVIIRFRQEAVAMVADVEGMFHQVRVAPDDCHVLRFLWWPNNDLSKEPVDYQMLVHLFGATSSPSCASFCLKKPALDNQDEFDVETIKTVNRNFYVDDCLKSVPTTDKAVRLSGQLRELLSTGGFRLTKWISNDRNVIATVPVTERAPSVVNLDLETNLIIQNCHRQQGHCGPSQVLAFIRQKFWIVRGLLTVRRVLANCMNCRKQNARPGEQIMAPLPSARVAPTDPPFTHVGVDYFGPFFVKQGRSQVKRYGCLFTCLTMRAVHIEVAHTLEADSFICAYQRFVSRRGKPKEIFSDNGTNFTGAERELREALERLDKAKIYDSLRSNDVQWSFNPPEASHQGGIWERIIRSVRKILGALLKEQLVNDETLSTLLCEVERILNDRPLTSLSDHPDDPEPLTPSKLLLLRSNSCFPPDVFKGHDKYSKRWRQVQCLADSFWKRWMKEYLPALQTRQKWSVSRRNFALGDLVLVVDDKTPRGRWPMGLIEEVFPDSNGYVRSVKVKTATSVYRRDIRKLCLLEGVQNP